MKKALTFTTFFMFMFSVLAAFGQTDSANIRIAPAANVIYTCTMHPEIVAEQPGNCPKCGMALVQKNSSSQHQMNMMMCPTHGMVNTNHRHEEQKKDKKNMLKGMGIGMGAMMVVGIAITLLRGRH